MDSAPFPLAAPVGFLQNHSVPDPATTRNPRNPWTWVPTLYFAEGIPYALVTGASIALYKDLKVSNAEIAFYTSWVSLPWVLKPLWSPVVDLLKTRRLWIWSMQFVLGTAFAAVALALPGESFLRWTLAAFFLAAFSSATHDIAADGFYMLANSSGQQSFFSGVRNTFYRLAMICAQGQLLILVGHLRKQSGNAVHAWQIAISFAAAVMLLLATFHFFMLPKPASDVSGERGSIKKFFSEFFGTFKSFFRKPGLPLMLLFLLFYRFGEVQLVKMVQAFLLDPRDKGGLGLTDDQVGLVYGTIGIAALLLGGIAGGVLVSLHGLRAWLWPMVIIMHVPDLVFVFLSHAQPARLSVIGSCLALEQFGYGFGFSAYMLYMLYIARGKHQTAHYAICTGFMALGAMIPGMWSGWLQTKLGYPHFFVWVLLATIPGFIVTALVPLDPAFGKKER